AWSLPANHGYSSWCSIGDAHWSMAGLIARGEISDVYIAERARWPTERVLIKVLRDVDEAPLFDHEWDVLEKLQHSTATGAASFSAKVPQPVVRCLIQGGNHAGAKALVLRWASGFIHTFEAVRRAYPGGIEPRPSIWMWRRILEVLSFLHRCGMAHGAVLPEHLLIQDNEHGVRLVGYSRADQAGARLRPLTARSRIFYPAALLDSGTLTPAADVQMSARCMAFVLGGDPTDGEVPGSVPAPLASLIKAVASSSGGAQHSHEDAWTLHERLGELADAVFGPPA